MVDLAFDFIGRDRSLSRTMRRVSGEADRTRSSLGSIAGGLVGGAAGAAIGGFLKGGIEGMKSAQEASAQTAAVLKSMGPVAGRTQDQIEGMADKIEKMSGLEAENVQAGQNMLLTFDNIRGANFDRATMSMADMSARMGGDAVGAATMLGKALQDPAKGMSALSRVGVSFSAQQKQQILAMQKSGDSAGAQTIMLKALESQFGGSAKAAGQTMGGQMKILQARYGDVQEEVVGKLLPAGLKLMDWLSRTISFVQRNSDVIVPLVATLGTFAAVVYAVNTAARVYAATQAALNLVMTANPIGLVVVAIAALVAGLIIAYRKSETFRSVVQAVFRAVGTAVLTAVDVWLGALQGLFSAASHIPGIGGKFKGVADAIGRARGKVDSLKEGLDRLPATKTVKVGLVVNGINSVSAVQAKLDRLDGRRAAGGPVKRGGSYLVGERGPELFVPSGSGGIMPNRGTPGGGGLHVTISGPVYGTNSDELARKVLTSLRRAGGNGTNLGLA